MTYYTKEEIALAKELLDAIRAGKSIDYIEGRLEAMIELNERDHAAEHEGAARGLGSSPLKSTNNK